MKVPLLVVKLENSEVMLHALNVMNNQSYTFCDGKNVIFFVMKKLHSL